MSIFSVITYLKFKGCSQRHLEREYKLRPTDEEKPSSYIRTILHSYTGVILTTAFENPDSKQRTRYYMYPNGDRDSGYRET